MEKETIMILSAALLGVVLAVIALIRSSRKPLHDLQSKVIRQDNEIARVNNVDDIQNSKITDHSDRIKDIDDELSFHDAELIRTRERIDLWAEHVKRIHSDIGSLTDATSAVKENLSDVGNRLSRIEHELSVLKKQIRNRLDIDQDTIGLNELPVPVSAPPGDAPLIEEKQIIFDLMENTSKNLLITGKGGTGKSYLLQYFKEHTKKMPLYCAPTGVAAIHIGGVTLHSFFGFDNLQLGAAPNMTDALKKKLQAVRVLIIDEISMVNADVLQKIDLMFRSCEDGGYGLPFGGRQVILFGDFFQLPPVVKEIDEERYLKETYKGSYFFFAPAFNKADFEFHELKQVFRFKADDPLNQRFIHTLDHLREGRQTPEDIDFLNDRVLEIPYRVPRLTPTRNAANAINMAELQALDEELFPFSAEIKSYKKKELNQKDLDNLEKDLPCTLELKLKVGALIMMVANDPEHRWVNGTLGTVSYLSKNRIKVKIETTPGAVEEYELEKQTFEKRECVYDEVLQKIRYNVTVTVKQYPLILAYAFTIHKSQGSTYRKLACNVKDCFESGQAYVALSRCSDYNNLYLTSKIDPNSAFADPDIITFYNRISKS